MKKINNYSAQFKIIQKPMNTNMQSQRSCENQFDEKVIEKNNPKKKLSKQNQESINKISANGFKQFILQ